MNAKTATRLLQKVVEDYDNISTEFDRTRKSDWKEFQSFLPYIKDKDFFIDLGCGNGRLSEFISKQKRIDYLGIDNSRKLLEKAKKNYPERNFEYGDLLNTNCKNNSADVVAAIASFHHLPSQKLRQASLREIHRILKKNGIFILSVWNLHQPKYKKYVWQARVRHLLSLGRYDLGDTFIPWGKSGTNRYYHAFTPKKLKKLLIKNGFKILEEKIDRNIVLICQKS